jgi:tetratricopeptide (TPR) repeat protein
LKFRLNALLGTGYMLIRSWGADEVEQSYATALSYSDAAEDVREKIWLNWGIWVFRQVRGELDACHDDALRIARIAEASEDIEAQLVANMVQMQVAFYRGRLRDSIRHGKEIERLYDPIRHDVLKDSYSLDLLLVWHVHAAQCHWLRGDAAAAMAALTAAKARADTLDHAHSKTWATVWSANLHLMADHPQAVFATVPEAVENAERRGFDYVSRLGRLILAAAGLGSEPRRRNIREIERAIADFRETGAAIVIPYFNALTAKALASLGDVDAAIETIETVLADIDAKGERWSQALALFIKGDVLTLPRVGDASGAQACYREAAEVAAEQGAEFWRCLAELRLVRGQVGHDAKLREQSIVAGLAAARALL